VQFVNRNLVGYPYAEKCDGSSVRPFNLILS